MRQRCVVALQAQPHLPGRWQGDPRASCNPCVLACMHGRANGMSAAPAGAIHALHAHGWVRRHRHMAGWLAGSLLDYNLRAHHV